jgi:S-(hydroxymethyl)glutathione dehydrogenase/alcohol dehydrogenase
MVAGGAGGRFPMVGGHEGAGIVEEVGLGVTRVKPGDHIVGQFIPSCGHCRWCSTGHQYICDVGRFTEMGSLMDGTYRFHGRGHDMGQFSRLGTFSELGVISEHSLVKMDDDIPFEPACLVGCGVPTGWGSAVSGADVEPGETVVIYGIGGVGMSAVQGARIAGAKNIVVVDPQPFKLEKAPEFGATHVAATPEQARDIVFGLTSGVWADKAIVTVGVMNEEVITNAYNIISKAGTLVLTGLGNGGEKAVNISSVDITRSAKRIQGVGGGNLNMNYDIIRLLNLYKSGDLKLDEMITRTYKLEEVNQGYQDMLDGKNIRGVIVF